MIAFIKTLKWNRMMCMFEPLSVHAKLRKQTPIGLAEQLEILIIDLSSQLTILQNLRTCTLTCLQFKSGTGILLDTTI
jgi:hypothetical protein